MHTMRLPSISDLLNCTLLSVGGKGSRGSPRLDLALACGDKTLRTALLAATQPAAEPPASTSTMHVCSAPAHSTPDGSLNGLSSMFLGPGEGMRRALSCQAT